MAKKYVVVLIKDCRVCGGSGKSSTARSASGRELERHERRGSPCFTCNGAKWEVESYVTHSGVSQDPGKAAVFGSKAAAEGVSCGVKGAAVLRL